MINFEFLILNNSPEFEINNKSTKIGKLGIIDRNYFGKKDQIQKIPKNIVHNNYAKRYIEKIASTLYFNEPCLLIGDTGCGKTTLAQHISDIFYKKLYVYNMNQGSDAIDLIGGFKPI